MTWRAISARSYDAVSPAEMHSLIFEPLADETFPDEIPYVRAAIMEYLLAADRAGLEVGRTLPQMVTELLAGTGKAWQILLATSFNA